MSTPPAPPPGPAPADTTDGPSPARVRHALDQLADRPRALDELLLAMVRDIAWAAVATTRPDRRVAWRLLVGCAAVTTTAVVLDLRLLAAVAALLAAPVLLWWAALATTAWRNRGVRQRNAATIAAALTTHLGTRDTLELLMVHPQLRHGPMRRLHRTALLAADQAGCAGGHSALCRHRRGASDDLLADASPAPT